MILKYSMMKMRMSKGDMYQLTVATLMRSVLTFNHLKGIKQLMKLSLIYRKGRQELNLEDYELYTGDGGDESVSESEKESSINVANPRLAPGIRAASTFHQALVDVPESQFVDSPGLSDVQHNRQHIRDVIAPNKEYNIYPRPYHLDTLSPPVLSTEAIDEIARRYLCLPLARADDFHRTQVEHEIAWLDIIAAQAINRASALKATLNYIQSQKAKRLEQLEIIAAIKSNNLQSESKILKEQAELDRLYPQTDSPSTVKKSDPLQQESPNWETPIYSPHSRLLETQEQVDVDKEKAYLARMAAV